MITKSTITCPECGFKATEQMPTDACRVFYDCKGCGERLKPKPGDCCVFCSYGTVPCPPIQLNQACCAQRAGHDRNREWRFFAGPAYIAPIERRSAMKVALIALALLAASGAVCVFCL